MILAPIRLFEFEIVPRSPRVFALSIGLSLVFVCMAIFLEPFDLMIFKGEIAFFGNLNLFIWITSGSLLFGITGALLIANVNPLFSIISNANPLAPLWFIENTLNGLLMIAVLKWLKAGEKEITYRQFILAGLVSSLGLVPEVMAIPIYFQKGIETILAAVFLDVVAVIVGSTLGFFLS